MGKRIITTLETTFLLYATFHSGLDFTKSEVQPEIADVAPSPENKPPPALHQGFLCNNRDN